MTLLSIAILISAMIVSLVWLRQIKLNSGAYCDQILTEQIRNFVNSYMGQAARMKSNNTDSKLTTEERRELTDHVIQCAIESTAAITQCKTTDKWTYQDLVSRVSTAVKEAKYQWASVHGIEVIEQEDSDDKDDEGEGWKV